MNLIIIDCETTGLDPQKHEIIEIGAIRVSTSETFEVKIYPLRIKEADPIALRINGYDKEGWKEAYMPSNALKLLSEFAGKDAYMMAYNVSFDRAFLEKAYKDYNLPYPFHYHHLDLLTLAWEHLPPGSPLSLKNVAGAFGVPSELPIHRALGGAQCAYQVLKKIMENSLEEDVCYGCGYLSTECRCEKNETDIDHYEELKTK